MHTKKHKDCQLESENTDSRSSLQGATSTAKTNPSNAYQQQNTKAHLTKGLDYKVQSHSKATAKKLS